MRIDINDFEIKECGEEYLPELLAIQDEAFEHLESPELLRKNTPEMLLECLRPPHVTLGAFYRGRLAAFSILYFPQSAEERLSDSLSFDCGDKKTVNYKLCIVRKDFWGNSLQYELASRLVERARDAGMDIICATASPHNKHSERNILRLGFKCDKTLEKYGLSRNLYYKELN